MHFNRLAQVFGELEETSSSLAMRELLGNFFRDVETQDIAFVCYLTLGRLCPARESLVLSLSEKSLARAVAKASSRGVEEVTRLLEKKGDLGLVAEQVLTKKPMTLVPIDELTIHELYEQIHKIAATSGTGSAARKEQLVVRMLGGVEGLGARYLIRVLLGNLRMGVGEMTLLHALALAFEAQKEALEKVYNIHPDIGSLAHVLATQGMAGVEKIGISVGDPIKMMLAQRVSDLEEVNKKIPGDVVVEGKYDGERVQAHGMKNGEVVLYSRRLENISAQFPDLISYLKRAIKDKEWILEGEILAIDSQGNPLAFQTLMQRRRKNDIDEYIKKIPVILKAFDLLCVDAENVMDKSYRQRREMLSSLITQDNHVMLAEQIITSDVSKMDSFFRKMLNEGYEGVIIKSLEGSYQAGTRGWNWIKWKKEYVEDMVDSFDLVVIGAFHGRGKRSGGYGALLCACYDESQDKFLSVCKLGTGLSDAVLDSLGEKFKDLVRETCPARVVVKKEMTPDVWFSPEVVVEVNAAEVTKSPLHALGFALRFPRFIQFREKNSDQATSAEEIREMAP